ncbi:AbrB/MazE/SpoVT family DNA-binding domain-containing protein [Persephonella sp. KM09-Lau-8]|uniref:AbrB/MazE/SpoVT family DNA-binding domain-containing protein n=1 Tax=Persephonella sp. KM09-Lau-8 TaxID=1158345 RepID=UPI00068C385C|nr:AbrB/MazE/SpoVT family DNA-binding domain-containing protein [Persephonella sp. KM09-Lau-8]
MFIAKITKKGQITIPAEIRRKLKTNIVEIEEKNGEIVIKPVKNLAGILQKYAKKRKSIDEILKEEKEAFANAVKAKHSNY